MHQLVIAEYLALRAIIASDQGDSSRRRWTMTVSTVWASSSLAVLRACSGYSYRRSLSSTDLSKTSVLKMKVSSLPFSRAPQSAMRPRPS